MKPIRLPLVAVVLAVLLLVSGCVAEAGAAPANLASGSTAQQAADKLKLGFTSAETNTSVAKRSLANLAVASPGSMAGYSRALFPHWKDASSWGWPTAPNDRCTARNAALFRDGVNVTMSSSCTRLAGRWLDPYTAAWLTKASDLDIDHLVPLAEAWRSGADAWTTVQRTAYANNPLVLVSVDNAANESKSDSDPAVWKPENKASWCLYAKRWIAVKAQYRLSVDRAEKAALTSMLGTCAS